MLKSKCCNADTRNSHLGWSVLVCVQCGNVCVNEDACQARRIRAALKKAKEQQDEMGGSVGKYSLGSILTDRRAASKQGRYKMDKQY